MDYFESNFRDQLDNHTPELPEGFDWENMKDGIEEKMNNSRRSGSKRWWPLLLLLLISGCGGWLFVNNYNKEKIKAEQANDPSFLPEFETAIIDIETDTPSLKNTATLSKQEDESIASNKITLPKNEPRKPQMDSGSKIKEEWILKTDKNNLLTAQQSGSDLYTQLSVVNPNEKREKVENAFVTRKPSEPLAPLMNLNSPLEVEWNLKEPKTQPDFDKYNRSALEVSLLMLGGLSSWNNKLKSDRNTPYISNFVGYSIRPEITLRKNKWSLSLAYQYDRLKEKFEYEGTTTIKEERADVLVEQVLNSFTGATIKETRIDTIINVDYFQRELKYNSFDIHQLDFSLGRSLLGSNRHNLTLNAGLGLTLSFTGNGKRLNELRLVDEFELNSPSTPGALFSFTSNLHYAYHLNEQFSVITRIQIRQHLKEIEIETSDSIRPLVYGVQLGVQCKF